MKYIPSSSYASPGSPSAIPKIVQKRRTFHIFGFIATTLLILSLVAAGAVFFYKGELQKQLLEAQSALSGQSTDDNEKKIAEIGSFHLKLKTADLLLDNHKAPSKLFAELEKITKKSVQITSLTYTYDPGFEVTLELTGRTSLLSSVALQKMKLTEDGLFSVYAIEGITSSLESLDGTGGEGGLQDKKVGFGVKGLVREGLVDYAKPVSPSPTPVAEETITPTEVATSTEPIIEADSATTSNAVTP